MKSWRPDLSFDRPLSKQQETRGARILSLKCGALRTPAVCTLGFSWLVPQTLGHSITLRGVLTLRAFERNAGKLGRTSFPDLSGRARATPSAPTPGVAHLCAAFQAILGWTPDPESLRTWPWDPQQTARLINHLPDMMEAFPSLPSFPQPGLVPQKSMRGRMLACVCCSRWLQTPRYLGCRVAPMRPTMRSV